MRRAFTNVPVNIVATKGIKQVSKMTSGERGKTVTVICAMSAAGTYLPPIMIFPRKRMIESLMAGAPPQSLGCCSASGWTDSTLFVRWLQYFVQFINSSRESQHVIVMGGHHSPVIELLGFGVGRVQPPVHFSTPPSLFSKITLGPC